jgi:hypothetical protein
VSDSLRFKVIISLFRKFRFKVTISLFSKFIDMRIHIKRYFKIPQHHVKLLISCICFKQYNIICILDIMTYSASWLGAALSIKMGGARRRRQEGPINISTKC